MRTWPKRAVSRLQDWCEYTDYNMIREAATFHNTTDLKEYTASVTGSVSKCTADVTSYSPVDDCWSALETLSSGLTTRQPSAQFEAPNNMPGGKTTTTPNDLILYLSATDIRKALSDVKCRKAAGPNILGRLLSGCATWLVDVLSDIFNIFPS